MQTTYTTYKYNVTLPLPEHCEEDFRVETKNTFEEAQKSLNFHNQFVVENNLPELVVSTDAITKKAVSNRFAIQKLHTDCEPFEIVRVVSETTIEIREMDAKPASWNQEWVSGGFAGHCSNQDEQKWVISSNEANPTIRIRWSKAKQQWQHGGLRFNLSTQPVKFYDYNFLSNGVGIAP